MKRTSIPDDVGRFIVSQIPSVPYLEALLLLRSTPSEIWTARQLARRLYMHEKSAADVLAELRADGLLVAVGDKGGHRYQPADDVLRSMIDRVAEAYASNLVDISNLIHSRHNQTALHFSNTPQSDSGPAKK